ncbi:MAG: SpoIID/LytB domain-containing protein [Salinivirgaceae bacterium]|jgi:stage II sporulation protein D|nr:SpoIID/LytB domain-containing protein [Salinivirgaceae bacterium]
MKTTILSILLIIYVHLFAAGSNNIKVELFNQFNIKTVMVSPIEGKYEFTTNKGKAYKLKKNNIIYFTLIRDSISVWDLNKHLGVFKWIKFTSISKENAFKIEPAYPALTARIYEGDFQIKANDEKFEIVNTVPIESYLAGVVEAESGPNAPYEFYKSQSIISRTYLLELITRQGTEIYRIGDDVNHQVYKGMSLKNPIIKQAVTHTRGLVIVDTTNQLITATFHSNSGGQTANSEDVWLTETSYLKGANDPFSLEQRNTHWKDSILIKDWLEFLTENGFNISNDAAKIDNLSFKQEIRQKYYSYKDDTVSLRKIRSQFNLRSTWFSIEPKGNYLVISGNGYGHGVGLSQEGAMQMARQNYSFLDIIYYYYKNVKVINYNLLVQ